ncbi:MAG: hypothetical protein JW822_03110 [Spirochaetales bacterium]|nr:hypothetical protein [Spirochaetales bacterium]
MKKIIVLSLLLWVLAFSAFTLDFGLGVKAGGSLVLGTGEETPDYESPIWGWGFLGGIALDIGILDFLSVEIDVFYTGMNDFGYNSDGSLFPFGPAESAVQSISLIEIPILVKGSFELGPGSLFASAGADLFFLLAEPVITQDDNELDESLVPDADNTFLYGIVAGFGYIIPVGMGELSIEFRYKCALNYYYEEDGPTGKDSGFQSFELVLGFYFL